MTAQLTVQSLLRRVTGLTVSKSIAERAMLQRMELTNAANSAAYLEAITPDEMTQLVELVVVPESWLFRDPQAFYATVELVRERWSRGRLTRIASIPCAGGEEPYSMAMALRDGGVPSQAFSIDAYDLSPACIERAQAGIYGRNAFRAQDVAFRERYFSALPDDGLYRIDDALRTQITFRQGNLLEMNPSALPQPYDVLFCRNLLIYFDKPTTRAAIDKLSSLLADDGMLLAGYAEVPSFCQHGFTPLPYRQAFALKKSGTASATTPSTVPAAPVRIPRMARATPATRPLPAAAPLQKPVTPAAAPPRPIAARPAVPKVQADLLAEARLLADRGQLREAGDLCHAHLARHAEAAEAYFMLGMINELAGKMDLAEDYWRRCIYLQPDHYEALCHLSLLAERNGNHTAASTLKARAARVYQRRQAGA